MSEEQKKLFKEAIQELIREGKLENLSRDERVSIQKEVMANWLDDIFKTFGKWSLQALGAAGVVAFAYFLLKMNGWNHS